MRRSIAQNNRMQQDVRRKALSALAEDKAEHLCFASTNVQFLYTARKVPVMEMLCRFYSLCRQTSMCLYDYCCFRRCHRGKQIIIVGKFPSDSDL